MDVSNWINLASVAVAVLVLWLSQRRQAELTTRTIGDQIAAMRTEMATQGVRLLHVERQVEHLADTDTDMRTRISQFNERMARLEPGK